jgi:hypothetical protein
MRFNAKKKKKVKAISKFDHKFTDWTLYMTSDLLYFNTFRPVVPKLFWGHRPPGSMNLSALPCPVKSKGKR